MNRDHSTYTPNQWEMALHCNAISHWLGAYTEGPLHETQIRYFDIAHLVQTETSGRLVFYLIFKFKKI